MDHLNVLRPSGHIGQTEHDWMQRMSWASREEQLLKTFSLSIENGCGDFMETSMVYFLVVG